MESGKVACETCSGGGSGFVGRRLTVMLKNAGHKVTCISRTQGPGKITWQEVQNNGLPDCQAVVNLAGENISNPWKKYDESFKSILYNSRIDTTKFIAEAIDNSTNKPDVWVSSSAIGYYEASMTAEYSEESEGGQHDFLARLCRDWEQAALLSSSPDVRHVTVRIGLVLGREGGLVQKMFMPFFFGLGGPLGSGKQWFPWIHAEDAAGIISYAIENNHVTGVLNAVAPEANTNLEFTKAFAKALWRPAFFPVPEFAIKAAFGAERGTAMLEGQKVVPKRTLEMGYRFKFPDLSSACNDCSKLMAYFGAPRSTSST